MLTFSVPTEELSSGAQVVAHPQGRRVRLAGPGPGRLGPDTAGCSRLASTAGAGGAAWGG